MLMLTVSQSWIPRRPFLVFRKLDECHSSVYSCWIYRSDTTIVHLLRGTQKVAKFNEAKDMAYNTVEIRMAVIRLAQVETDLVISINAPVLVAPGSTDHATTATNVDQSIAAILSQLQVNDWSLFG